MASLTVRGDSTVIFGHRHLCRGAAPRMARTGPAPRTGSPRWVSDKSGPTQPASWTWARWAERQCFPCGSRHLTFSLDLHLLEGHEPHAAVLIQLGLNL